MAHFGPLHLVLSKILNTEYSLPLQNEEGDPCPTQYSQFRSVATRGASYTPGFQIPMPSMAIGQWYISVRRAVTRVEPGVCLPTQRAPANSAAGKERQDRRSQG